MGTGENAPRERPPGANLYPTRYSVAGTLALMAAFVAFISWTSGSGSVGNFQIPGPAAALFCWTAGLMFMLSVICLAAVGGLAIALVRLRACQSVPELNPGRSVMIFLAPLATALALMYAGYWLTGFLNARASDIDATLEWEWGQALVELVGLTGLFFFVGLCVPVVTVSAALLLRMPAWLIAAYAKRAGVGRA